MAGAELPAAGDIFAAPGPASPGGSGGQQFLPSGQAGRRGAVRRARQRNNVRLPVERPAQTIPGSSTYGKVAGIQSGNGVSRRMWGDVAPIGANQAENFIAARCGINRELLGIIGNVPALDPLSPPPFLFGKLKNAVDAYPGNAGFAVGQPALLGGDKAAENAAFPGIDGIVPFIAVFAGGPSFRLAESVGLVDAAVEGFAPVFGQGFQNGGSPVGMGKGLPVGTVPGDGTGLGRWIPPPLRKTPLERPRRPLHCVGTWLFPLGWG